MQIQWGNIFKIGYAQFSNIFDTSITNINEYY